MMFNDVCCVLVVETICILKTQRLKVVLDIDETLIMQKLMRT